ncbi:MAG: glycosyltransferase family 4 protein, partial [Candidatus Acidiferrales bacterium]
SYVRAMRREHRKGRASNFGWQNRLWHRMYHQTMYDFSIATAEYGAVANREAWTLAQTKYNRNPDRVCFVPNGTEERFFAKREYVNRESSRLLYVGTWLDRKGVFYLAEALRLVAETIPDVRLTVAGCLISADQVKSSFAPEVRDLVSVVPFVKREDMPRVYAEHDIFVFPSLVEGMPLTLLEAMASGMPVVTTKTSGMTDVVEDGVNGLLVLPADSENLAKSIEWLCRSTDLRRRLGQAGQESMRQYTWDRVVEKLEAVLRLASNGRATHRRGWQR